MTDIPKTLEESYRKRVYPLFKNWYSKNVGNVLSFNSRFVSAAFFVIKYFEELGINAYYHRQILGIRFLLFLNVT